MFVLLLVKNNEVSAQINITKDFLLQQQPCIHKIAFIKIFFNFSYLQCHYTSAFSTGSTMLLLFLQVILIQKLLLYLSCSLNLPKQPAFVTYLVQFFNVFCARFFNAFLQNIQNEFSAKKEQIGFQTRLLRVTNCHIF